ncbi:MAG: glycosyltransferase family 4 protein [Chloroflexi bacterium]|nr:glycosyltransferase family 4 protein [Chloroflexota bacterium]
MNIALVSAYDFAYPGGVTAHISKLSECFGRLGHEVTILAPSSKKAQELGVPNLEVVGRWPVSFPSGGSAARITISPWLSGRVKSLLQERGFDVVHLHEPLLPALPITVLRFSRAVNVGTFHAYHDTSLAYHYSRRILMRYFRRLQGKIAVSQPAMEFISRYFPGYYNIIPNGIDLEHFSPAKAPLEEYMDGKLNILFVGRMEKRKGLHYLLGAFRRVKARLPECRLLVVGPRDGAGPEYESLADLYGLKDVVFIGNVPYEDMPRFYSSAHVFCAPATGQESFGIVLLEAMASGKPIVASDIEGYATVLTHGQEGLLVPPEDEEALAGALLHLLEDEALRRRMGAMGWFRAQDFGWDRVSRMVLDYYYQLLEERPSPQATQPEPPLIRSYPWLRLK